MADLGQLKIHRVIVHEIPRRLVGSEVQPNLSEAEPPLTQELRNYFRERITGTLTRAAFDVVFDPTTTSPVPGIVAERLSKGARGFIQASHEMARHLNVVQTGANSGGLLVAALGAIAGTSCVAILKLEKEQGVRVREEEVKGKHTLSIEHIRELMLTERTRVFKVGLFWTSNEIIGEVSDNQQPRSEVADFFLRKYLGCILRTAPDVLTRSFVDATEKFINDVVEDPERKARYQIAILSEIGRSVGTISPQAFAHDHLEVEDQDPFIEVLREADAPIRTFPKDIELVKSRIQRMRLDFESGVMLLAPPQAVDERVRLESRPDGQTHVEFEDRLKAIHGRH